MIETQNHLDAIIREVAKPFHVPTLCVGVYQNGKTFFYCKGKSQQGNADVQTVFPIGSASKAFIATAVMQLCNAGKLDLDTPIIQYLPEFTMYSSQSTSELTLRDALCHRSGLPRHDISLFTNQETPLAQMVDNIKYLEMAFPPRARFCYQNHMFGLASRIVEQVSGLSWGDYVQQNIFDKLNMTHSYTISQEYEQRTQNYATPKLGLGFLNIPTKNMRCDSTGGAGAISSNAEELLRWAQTNLHQGQYEGETIFEKQAADELHKSQMPIKATEMFAYSLEEVTDTSYGFGWFVEHFRGEKFVHHGGTISGFRSTVGFMPSQDFAFCILSNRNNTQAVCALEYALCDEALGEQDGHWSRKFLAVERKKNSIAKKKYTDAMSAKQARPMPIGIEGFYSNPAYGTVQVFVKGKGYQVKLADFKLPIVPVENGEYLLHSSLMGIAFACRFGKDEMGIPCFWVKLEEMIDSYICFTKNKK